MVAETNKLRVAAVGDLHTHHTHRGEHRAIFTEISEQADVLALCGDLTNLGDPAEAEALADDLGALKIPAVAVLGNHDHHHEKADEVRSILRKAGVNLLEEETFVFQNVGFAGVKGFGGGFGNRMLASFGEQATKNYVAEAVKEALALESSLNSLTTSRNVVVLHYSPILDTCSGEPAEIMPFIGSARLGETIDRFDIAAVFHGHAHHGSLKGKTTKGVPVYNCSLELLRRTKGKGFIVIEV